MTIAGVIRDLERCADQNEADSKGSSFPTGHAAELMGSWADPLNGVRAGAVAGEQRRMIRILKPLAQGVRLSAAAGKNGLKRKDK